MIKKNYDGKNLLYLMAGIPDVTNKLEEKNAANKIIYQEVVFNYEPNMLFHFKQLMDGTQQLLSNIDCIPIFATIPTMNLLNWNTIRYAQGKICFLKYENDHGMMQDNLSYLLLDVNKSIITFNNLNGKKTLIYINFRNYVVIEGEPITTTYMWMGSIQMESYWQSGAIDLIKLLYKTIMRPLVYPAKELFFFI